MDQSTRQRRAPIFCRTPLARALRFETLEDRRVLAVLTVDTDQDVVDFNDGVTSLREAIFAANIVPGADEIVFDFGEGPKTILLTQGELKVQDSLLITGPGASFLTIDASGSDPTPNENNGDGSRIFFISDGTNAVLDVEISGATLTGGDNNTVGGAIHSWENVAVFDSRVENNSSIRGGGIYGQASVVVVDSFVSGNTARTGTGGRDPFGGYGGGILANSLVLTRSTVEQNTARLGAGLISGQMTIEGSVVSGNFGDGIHAVGEFQIVDSTIATNTGRGIFTHISDGTIRNSTISGNTAGGLVGLNNSVEIEHSTITANGMQNGMGGGIETSGPVGSVRVHSSIIAGNIGRDVTSTSDSIVSEGYNLIGVGTGAVSFNQPGDQVGVLDPLLGSLANNGGPTPNHALLPGSPAINAGDHNAVTGENGVPEFDQRGEPFTRVFGGRIDIGAFEAQSLVVDTLIDENDGDYSEGDFSLREAIELANLIEGANTIEFDPTLAGGTIQLTIGQLNVKSSIDIVGLGRDLLTIDNSLTQGPIFNIDNASLLSLAVVSISGVTLTGSTNSAIRSLEDLTVDSVRIHGNTGALGGGIRVEQGGGQAQGTKLTVRNSIFSSNHSTAATSISSGGGVSFVGRDGELRIENSTFIDNQSANRGGGLQVMGFDNLVHIVDSTFSNNTAMSGGGISINDDNRKTATLERVTVTGNHASFAGAGIYISGKAVEIVDSLIAENVLNAGGGRTLGGGGIHKQGSDAFTIRNTIIRDNTSDGPGGGIALQGSSMRMEDSAIHGNTTNQNGGGLSAMGGLLVEINRSTFSNNTASASGGGIYSRSVGQLIVDATSIVENRADLQSGGGMLIQNKTTISNSLVANNWADDSGGGIAGSGEADIVQTTVSGNSAILGGGIALEGPTKVRHSTIARNIGRSSGGGINRITTNGAFTLENSLVTGNINNLGDPDDVAGVINSSYSLVGVGEQFLGPLADNGGPTKTHALLPNSPAINAGDPTLVGGEIGVPEFDQRGEPFTRVFGGRIDIGAFETQSFFVDTLVDESDGDYSSGDFSLREAIDLANRIEGANTIEFKQSLTGGTILLTMGELKITDDVQIFGLGANRLTVDAQGLSRVIHVDALGPAAPQAINVTIEGLTLTRGVAPSDNFQTSVNRSRGGGICFVSSGELKLNDVIVSHNSAIGTNAAGAGVYAFRSGIVSVSNSQFIENRCLTLNGLPSRGAGIYSDSNVSVADSSFMGNVGHAIHVSRFDPGSPADVSLIRTEINNTNGLGLHAEGLGAGTVEIVQSKINMNSAGGVLSWNGPLYVADSQITNNGGAPGGSSGLSAGGDITVLRSTVSGNSANGGGGIWGDGHIVVADSFIIDNHNLASDFRYGGGGILQPSHPNRSQTLAITNSVISNNSSAGHGGGIQTDGQVTILDSVISGNHAAYQGGGIFGGESSDITLIRSTVDGNTAVGFRSTGAGIYSQGDVAVKYSTISNNNQGTTAQATWGGIVAENVTLLNATISGNGRGGVRGNTIDARHSTITRNTGTGLYAPTISLDHTIVAGNIFSNQFESDVQSQNLQARYSQIAVGGEYLGPLANNGGPTKTHLLLFGSPARNAGDFNLRPGRNGAPEFDQRGAPFTRAAGRIDIGAYELQLGIPLNGDFDGDGDVDGRDFLIWQRGFGSTTPPVTKNNGDATGDGDVDGNDLAVWQATYGPLPPPRIVDLLLADDTVAVQSAEGATVALSSSAVSDVDAAFDGWQPPRRAVMDFGDIATRRKGLRALRR